MAFVWVMGYSEPSSSPADQRSGIRGNLTGKQALLRAPAPNLSGLPCILSKEYTQSLREGARSPCATVEPDLSTDSLFWDSSTWDSAGSHRETEKSEMLRTHHVLGSVPAVFISTLSSSFQVGTATPFLHWGSASLISMPQIPYSVSCRARR